MNVNDLKCYENKRIKILLKTRFVYTGFIIDFLDDSIKFRDKKGATVIISLDNISTITELNGVQNG